MVRLALTLALLLAVLPCAKGQWTLQPSPTTADLRGIDNVGNGIAWDSGTNGTILRTTDSGTHWQRCTIPPNAEHLDFRGIQAFDANTAIVMSSGPGDLSRLYKTTDACQTWTLLFTNPDKDGFFDALRLPWNHPRRDRSLLLLGDPVQGHFMLWQVDPFLPVSKRIVEVSRVPFSLENEAAFAASNSSLVAVDQITMQYFCIGTGGPLGASIIRTKYEGEIYGGSPGFEVARSYTAYGYIYASSTASVGDHTATSGVFSIDFAYKPHRHAHSQSLQFGTAGRRTFLHQEVAVGGDYLKPNDPTRTAAFSTDSGKTWTGATTQPHGFRSAVAYDPKSKTWITVGPNGTDVSTDDGRNWRAVTQSKGEAADADRNWNALSLPYVVGPHGRIGKLNPKALVP